MFSSVFLRSGVLSINSKTSYLHRTMANFKFSYVRSFEANDRLAPDQWIVISLENKNPEFKRQAMRDRQSRLKFTEFMNKNAIVVMDHFKEIRFSYVHSANAHFVFDGNTPIYQRRSSKLVSYIASCLSSISVMNWHKFLDFPMHASPCFEGKIFLFPNDQHLRDYFTLNQMNHHLENLRQTLIEAIKGDNPHIEASQSNPGSGSDGGCSAGGTIPLPLCEVITNKSESLGQPGEGFHCVTPGEKNAKGDSESLASGGENPSKNLNVQTGVDSIGKLHNSAGAMKHSDSQTANKKAMLANAAEGTEAYCNEKLYADYRINYNNEPAILKKGTLSLRHKPVSKTSRKEASGITSYHEDLRKNAFWESLSVVSSETNFNSKFFMLPKFQRDCSLVPHAWIVVRLDGKAFHKMAEVHKFQKPNDIRAIELMNISAATLMKAMPDVIIAYGESDEYSFVFHRYGKHYNRNPDALVSQCVSIFTAAYVKYWPSYFGECSSRTSEENVTESASKKDVENDSESPSARNMTDSLEQDVCATDFTPKKETVISKSASPESVSASEEVALKRVPVFDGRAVVYPTTNSLRDYLSWRQADCHVNNMYNTAFWALVLKGGYTRTDAEKKLNGTFSKDKRQILLDMGINYDEEPAIHRKGSFIYRKHKGAAKARYLKKELKPVRNEVWWSDQCHQLKKTRTELRKKYLQSNSDGILIELLKVEILASRIFKKAKKKYKHESRAASHSGSSLSQSSPEDSTTSSSSAGAEDHKIETSFLDDEEVVVPVNFLLDFEKRLNIDNIDPEERKKILSSFNQKRKTWWTMECHLAKVVRREALLAFKSAPSEESERAYHLACIRFRAFVHEAKTRQKKMQVLKRSKNASSEDNKENLARDEEGVKLDEHQEESCVQHEKVIDSIVNPLEEKEDNFVGVENCDEIISIGKADDVTKSESHMPETADEMKSGNECVRGDASEMEADHNTEADSKVTYSGSQEPMEDKSNSSSEFSRESDPSDNAVSAMQGRMAEHELRFASVAKDLVLCFSDIIDDKFWSRRPYILGEEKSALDFEESL